MILVDTSVWVDHLRGDDSYSLAELLDQGRVSIHRMVVGELACGNLHKRDQVLHLLAQLPTITEATHGEVMQFIAAHKLMGRGVGYIDMHLLASAALGNGVRLWTRDKRLAGVARELNLGFVGPDRST